MKKFYLLFVASYCLAISLNGQSIRDNHSLSLDASQYTSVRIHNYKGNVTVREVSGNLVNLKAERILTSKNKVKLEQAKEEVFIDTTVIDGELIMFINAPNRKLKIDENGQVSYNSSDWDNWSKKNIKKYEVAYEFTLDVTIPSDKDVNISTHRKDVDIKGFHGKLTASTHHGSIKVETASSAPHVNSHHGSIEVVHTSSKVKDGRYHTHHGDINTSFPSLSVDVSLSTRHGTFYTDFDYQMRPLKVSSSNSESGAKYKLGGNTVVRIGNGGGVLEYNTYHGDTFIRKN